jgi:hypothetical protein
MTRALRKHWLLFAAALCAGLAAVLALLAVDVSSWRTTVARDDLRFRASPTHAALWKPSTELPGDPASAVVGTTSTISWRRALQYFWYSRIGSNPEIRMDTPTLRAEAQDKLLAEIDHAPTAAQRSQAANLLGVLVVTTPAPGRDQDVILQILKRSAGYFQKAIELDPANADAKQNLELVYRIAKPGKGHLGKDARSGYGFGKGQGAVTQGNGY